MAQVQRLGVLNRDLAEPALELMLALSHGAVELLGETVADLMSAPRLHASATVSYAAEEYELRVSREGDFDYLLSSADGRREPGAGAEHKPYTLHLASCTPHPIPYTFYLTPYTPH